jgi:alpha-tubulin suppressor-like RCC1 family protein
MRNSKILLLIVIILCLVILTGCDISQSQKNDASQESIDSLLKAVGPGSQVVQVAAGYNFSMAIVRSSNGNQTLWVIGSNYYGQIGLGYTNLVETWTNTGLSNVTLVATSGIYYSSYCLSNNFLYVTGDNYSNQLGIDTSSNTIRNWTKTSYGNISAIACGREHAMFISWGNLWVAGSNRVGALGLNPGIYPVNNNWTQITYGNNITQIACGSFHSMYLSDNGANLYVTGLNYNGQLGLGYTGEPVKQWTRVPNIYSYGIQGIACGEYNSLIYAYGPLLEAPSLFSNWLWVTGSNRDGAIGLSSTTSQISSWQQLGYGNIVAIASGYDYSMFSSDGNLWVTGRNDYGQLGLGDTTNRYGWQPAGYANLQYNISCGDDHSLFISQNNTWGAGSNSYHELGVPSLSDSYYPWFIKN